MSKLGVACAVLLFVLVALPVLLLFGIVMWWTLIDMAMSL